MRKFLKLFVFCAVLCIGMCGTSAIAQNTILTELHLYNANGNEITDTAKVTGGSYQMSVKAVNRDNSAKDIDVFLAVKAEGRLYGLYQEHAAVTGKDDDPDNSAFVKFFNVAVPSGISADKISLEVFCWNEDMTPFCEKSVFGQEMEALFYAEGRIVGTYKDSGTGYGSVSFSVEKSDDFDGIIFGDFEMPPMVFEMYYDKYNADKQMFRYCEAVISKNSNDEYTIESLTPCADDAVTLECTQFAGYTSDSMGICTLEFYENAQSSKQVSYEMNRSGNVGVYVNGVRMGNVTDAINGYIMNNDATVTLIDETDSASRKNDGYYDYVMIEYYDDAIVDTVSQTSSGYKVYWKESSTNIIKGLAIDTSDEDVNIVFIKDGKEIEYTDIKENDVVSIAYDVYDFEYSYFYEVYVSDKTVRGMVTMASDEGYTIGNTVYYPSYSIYGYDNGTMLYVGEEYILYLNVFGKFIRYECDYESEAYGIVDSAYIDAIGDPYMIIINTDGIKQVCKVNEDMYAEYASGFFDTVPEFGSASGKAPLEGMLVEYRSNDYGLGFEILDARSFEEYEYMASANKIGPYALNTITKIIDVSDNTPEDIEEQNFVNAKGLSVEDLVDGNIYSGYVAEKSSTDATYMFVVITGVEESEFKEDEQPAPTVETTPFAVLSSVEVVYDEIYNTSVDVISAFAASEAETADGTVKLRVAPNCTYTKDIYLSGSRGSVTTDTIDEGGLNVGDVFTYTTNDSGYVTGVKILFNDNVEEYDYFLDNAMSAANMSFNSERLFTNNIYPVSDWLNTTSATGEVGMIFGPIMDKTGDVLTIGGIPELTENGYVIDIYGNTEDIYVSDDANIYIYDYSENNIGDRVCIGALSSITKTFVPAEFKYGIECELYKIADENKQNYDYPINYIVAKTVDGDITDALVILGNTY